LFRLWAWPYPPRLAIGFFSLLGFLAALAAYDQAWIAVLPLGLGALVVAGFARADCAKAMRHWRNAVSEYAAANDVFAVSVGTHSD
jgi:hypothetical protein